MECNTGALVGENGSPGLARGRSGGVSVRGREKASGQHRLAEVTESAFQLGLGTIPSMLCCPTRSSSSSRLDQQDDASGLLFEDCNLFWIPRQRLPGDAHLLALAGFHFELHAHLGGQRVLLKESPAQQHGRRTHHIQVVKPE